MTRPRHPIAEVTARTASILGFVMASAVLGGWLVGLASVTNILPGLATMKFNTALCFVVSAAALWLLWKPAANAAPRRAGLACALAVTIIALLTLAEYLFGWKLGIDELAVRDFGTDPATAPPGRMSMATAQSFVFLGLALLLIDLEWRRFRPAQFFAVLGVLAGLTGLLGYLYGVAALYKFFPYSSMALLTSALFVVLGVGVLAARPDCGLMAAITSEYIGGFLARRIIPVLLILSVAIGWLRLVGEHAGYYDTEVGTALLVVASIVVLMAAIWLGARSLNRMQARLEKRNRLYAVLSQCNQAIVRCRDRDELFPRICRVAVDYGGFRLAWIGLADPATETVTPAAFAGEESEFLAGLTISLRDVPKGRGPTGTAIREGRHVVCNDVRRDPRMAPWREVALMHGHGATAAFPVFEDGPAIGALCVHAEDAHFFGDEEVSLLDEVTADISFALKQFTAQRARSRLAAIVESSEDAIISTDLNGNVTSWNAGAESTFGYPVAEMLGRSIERLVAHKRNADYDQRVSRILRGEAPASFETAYIRKDRRTIDVSVCVSSVRDSEGKGTGLSIVARDITERKRSEVKLHFHEALLRETGRIAKVGGWQFDVATGEGFWTEEVARIHDLDPDDPTSRDIGLRFFDVESRSRIEAAIEAATRHGTPYDLELQITTAAGVRKWVRTIGHPVVEGGKVVRLRGTFQDISDRKRSERRQVTRNAVSRALADSANLSEATPRIMEAICEAEGWDFGAIWELDESADVLRCSEIWYRPEIAAAELAQRTREREFAPGEGLPGSVWSMAKGILISEVTAAGAYSRASGAAEAGMRSALAFPILRRGEVTGVLEFLASQIHDTDAALLDMFGVIGQQVGTFFERKRMEADARKLEQQLNQAQKMEAIGQLSGGIAHDFNNILSAINGHVHLAGRELLPEHPAQKNLNGIANASNRAKDLVRRILMFSREQDPERSVIGLEPIVEEVVQLLRASLPAMIEIRTSVAKDVPDVNADATQVHQILMNLATNASHAMAGESYGTLDIRLESVTMDEHTADIAPDLHEGRYARLSVSDTGCGMDEATLKRIFEPFFTTKGPHEGTGLGLAVVHGIMKSHEGAVTVYSQPGRGTMFRLYFPSARATAPAAKKTSTGPMGGKGEHVLFVDNEEPLVYIGNRILTRLGYRVTGFTDAVQALRAFLENPEGFDILISDCSMPQMTGFDLAADALRVRPDLPVILVSGFVRPQDREAAKSIGVEHLIVKPATVDELAQLLREVLDAVRSARSRDS